VLTCVESQNVISHPFIQPLSHPIVCRILEVYTTSIATTYKSCPCAIHTHWHHIR